MPFVYLCVFYMHNLSWGPLQNDSVLYATPSRTWALFLCFWPASRSWDDTSILLAENTKSYRFLRFPEYVLYWYHISTTSAFLISPMLCWSDVFFEYDLQRDLSWHSKYMTVGFMTWRLFSFVQHLFILEALSSCYFLLVSHFVPFVTIFRFGELPLLRFSHVVWCFRCQE